MGAAKTPRRGKAPRRPGVGAPGPEAADPADPADPLQKYRAKRAPDGTPEPMGSGPVVGRSTAGVYVVHEHLATRHHWDLRLEIDGVLCSWAVPKAPSMDPDDKRLAVKVENHPLEYVDFEAVIPAGNYGAGPMIVWDRGQFLPQLDPRQGLRDGEIKFELRGYKLRGAFTLVHTGKHRRGRGAGCRRCGDRLGPGSAVFVDRPVEPGVIGLLAHDLDGDRHVGVVLAAELGALAEIDALLIGGEPGIGEAAGDRVHLHAESRDGPGMDHVGAGHQELDHRAHGDHDRIVRGQEIIFVRIAVRFEILARQQQAVEGDLVVGIFVAPVPLVARHLDGQVGLRHLELLEEHGQREGADQDEDQHRQQRPGDLEPGIVGEARRGGVRPAVEPQHDDRQEHHHQQDDAEHDPVHPVRQPVHVLGDRARSRLVAGSTGHRRPDYREARRLSLSEGARRRPERSEAQRGTDPCGHLHRPIPPLRRRPPDARYAAVLQPPAGEPY